MSCNQLAIAAVAVIPLPQFRRTSKGSALANAIDPAEQTFCRRQCSLGGSVMTLSIVRHFLCLRRLQPDMNTKGKNVWNRLYIQRTTEMTIKEEIQLIRLCYISGHITP